MPGLVGERCAGGQTSYTPASWTRPSLDRPLEPRAFVRMDSLEERGPRRNSIEERAPHLVRDAAALTTALIESVGVGHASHSIRFKFGRATLHLTATALQIEDRLDSTLPRLGVPFLCTIGRDMWRWSYRSRRA